MTDGRVRRDGSEFSSSAVGGSHDRSQGFCPEGRKTNGEAATTCKTRPGHARTESANAIVTNANAEQATRPVGGDIAEPRRGGGVLRAPLIISCQSLENPKPLIKNRRQTNDYAVAAYRPFERFSNESFETLLFPNDLSSRTYDGASHSRSARWGCPAALTAGIHRSPADHTPLHPAFRQRGAVCWTWVASRREQQVMIMHWVQGPSCETHRCPH